MAEVRRGRGTWYVIGPCVSEPHLLYPFFVSVVIVHVHACHRHVQSIYLSLRTNVWPAGWPTTGVHVRVYSRCEEMCIQESV